MHHGSLTLPSRKSQTFCLTDFNLICILEVIFAVGLCDMIVKSVFILMRKHESKPESHDLLLYCTVELKEILEKCERAPKILFCCNNLTLVFMYM